MVRNGCSILTPTVTSWLSARDYVGFSPLIEAISHPRSTNDAKYGAKTPRVRL